MASKIMSALSAVYKAMVGRLTRKGVHVGGTAAYPRVEVHSIIEGEPLDKAGNVRQISCIIESISEEKIADIVQMNEDNLRLILSNALSLDGWNIIDILPGQAQMIPEVSETNAILYRLLQNITVYVERITE